MADNLDEATLKEMEKLDEKTNKPKKKQAEVKHQASFTAEELANDSGKVWVKCISELQPWANGVPMEHWKDYFIPIEEAILMDEHRHIVVLETPKQPKE